MKGIKPQKRNSSSAIQSSKHILLYSMSYHIDSRAKRGHEIWRLQCLVSLRTWHYHPAFIFTRQQPPALHSKYTDHILIRFNLQNNCGRKLQLHLATPTQSIRHVEMSLRNLQKYECSKVRIDIYLIRSSVCLCVQYFVFINNFNWFCAKRNLTGGAI